MNFKKKPDLLDIAAVAAFGLVAAAVVAGAIYMSKKRRGYIKCCDVPKCCCGDDECCDSDCCHEDEECSCGDEECRCHEDEECSCGDEECRCHEDEECSCGDEADVKADECC